MPDMTPLDELARFYETDKGGYHLRYGGGDSDTCHAYCYHYHAMFKDKRETVSNVLEIGTNRGCSLKMWADYFPNARIIGIDSDQACMKGGSWSLLTAADTRIFTIAADQNNAESLTKGLWSHSIGPSAFDVIIDDGSHERPHQRVSLEVLLPYLVPGGIYVVEDLGLKFYASELAEAPIKLGWPYYVINVEGGKGKAAGTEALFVVERPL